MIYLGSAMLYATNDNKECGMYNIGYWTYEKSKT
jgi:hypothetical protein